jgi:signal transduction histidine kinase
MTARWLPRTRDVTAVALGALVAADALVAQLRDHHPVTAWAAFAGAGVGAVALWWRRAHPVAVTVLGLALCVTVHIEWTLAAGLTTLAIRRRDRVTWSLSAAAVAALTVESLAGGTHGHPGLVGSLSLAVPWVALFACTGAFLGQRRDAIAGLKERAERAEAEQEMRAEQSRLNERTRIAAEMHDVLAHRISLIALHAGGLEVTEDPDAEAVRQTAGLIRETAHTALEDLRGILGVLKTPDGRRAELTPQPRFADVGGLIRASADAGIPITLSGGLDLDADVPEPLGRAAYRVVQESLTNVHKHAAGAETLIRVAVVPGRQLEICVENLAPPVPAPSLPGSGSGLVGLRERVAVAGGTLDARPLRGGGFRVRARLPWPVADVPAAGVEDGEDFDAGFDDAAVGLAAEMPYEGAEARLDDAAWATPPTSEPPPSGHRRATAVRKGRRQSEISATDDQAPPRIGSRTAANTIGLRLEPPPVSFPHPRTPFPLRSARHGEHVEHVEPVEPVEHGKAADAAPEDTVAPAGGPR